MKTIINFSFLAFGAALLGVTYELAPAGSTFVMAMLLGVLYLFLEMNREVSESGSAAKSVEAGSKAAWTGESDRRLAA